eukprot:CAMPEP_0205865286 /NCGR_PEP_ID=MMETSP1083-20121108/7804_1 /ASSEMBLY_ACC=CAM_ASM_000430 /TAXON_ID=97485 /ORGANISM="Prymnesium parvum, Strain Texoma1" /LENGTH=90 /DNA_ID=CAMNT_0053227211 /DNA_START=754 /DNA_END=1023 /DNA_ORIENTATION=+
MSLTKGNGVHGTTVAQNPHAEHWQSEQLRATQATRMESVKVTLHVAKCRRCALLISELFLTPRVAARCTTRGPARCIFPSARWVTELPAW